MTLLLIGGTREAGDVAARLEASGGRVMRRRSPTGRAPVAGDEDLADEVRMRALLAPGRVDGVLDMGHPFEAELSARLWRVASERGVPILRYLRPPWTPGPGDRWTDVPDEEGAAQVVPGGATVFLATGRESLPGFAELAMRGATLWCRVLSPPPVPFPFARGGWLHGTPPFSRSDEVACLREIGADWMVARNAGGTGNVTKLQAAADLGLPVAMIAQPAASGAVTRDLTEAADWGARWA